MSSRFSSSLMAMAAVLAVLLLAPVLTAAQTTTAATNTWHPPRTPDGQPDVQGLWTYRGSRLSTYSIEEGASEEHLKIHILNQNRSDVPVSSVGEFVSLVVDPADGKIPYQPWAAAKRAEIKANYMNPKPEHLDPDARCFLSGVPRVQYDPPGPFQILQPPGYVVILYEVTNAYRIIPLDARPPIADNIKLFMGNSRGRWEGNTLVVDVANHNDRTWFDIVGDFHSDAMHVVERWTFVDADTINYEATIEDPKVFTRPWKMAFPFARNKDKGHEVMEYACHEGKRDVQELLRSDSNSK